MAADPAIVLMNSRLLIASPVEGQGFVPSQPNAFCGAAGHVSSGSDSEVLVVSR
jgi:hypothetical protein